MLGHGHRGVKGEQRNPAGTNGDAEGELEHERWDQRIGNHAGDDRRSRAAGAGKRYRRDHRHVMAPSSPMLAGSSPEASSRMIRRSASARRTGWSSRILTQEFILIPKVSMKIGRASCRERVWQYV